MTNRDPIVVTLGDQHFKIRPLTISQAEAIEGVASDKTSLNMTKVKGVIAAALKRDYPSIDVEELETTPGEAGDVMSSILKFGGFMPASVTVGEASAAAEANAPTGQVSAAA